jgi:CRP-like cAMP-binding protein
MLRTPEHLTKEFAIAPEAGQGRAIPRVLFAYTGQNKSRFLATTISAIMAGALPEYGQKRTWRRDVSHDELAAMCGVARETYTRRLSEIANPDESWQVDRRLQQRDRARARHQLRGHRIHEKERPSREHVATLINRRRRFMRPNVYTSTLPAPSDRRNSDKWYPPNLQDLASCEQTRGLFRALEDGEAGYRGFKNVPRWVWDSRLPLTSNARLVLTYYFMVGMLEERRGKIVGMVRPRQAVVANAVGISVRSVYQANGELARLSLIRVAHSKPISTAGGFVRGPQMIIYLPIRQLSCEEAEFERQRLKLMAQTASSASSAAWMIARVKELHAALLSDWEGKEHYLSAFWKQVRRSAIADGIHLSVINRLIPSPPE